MLRRIMLTAVVAVGCVLGASADAQAQWGSFSFGFGRSPSFYGGHGIGSHRIVTPSYRSGYGSHHSGYGSHHSGYGSHHSGHHYAPPVWHDTTHLDYHAPSLQPHGDHFDYVPGHYDVHRSGHWDSSHGGHGGHGGHH